VSRDGFPWTSDFLKTSTKALKHSIVRLIFLLRISNLRAQPSFDRLSMVQYVSTPKGQPIMN